MATATGDTTSPAVGDGRSVGDKVAAPRPTGAVRIGVVVGRGKVEIAVGRAIVAGASFDRCDQTKKTIATTTMSESIRPTIFTTLPSPLLQ